MNSHENLIQAAVDAKSHSYSPYSKFRVGCALLTRDLRVFTGCNVENCAYGESICAERTAVVKAVSEGFQDLVAVVIASDQSTGLTMPCGSCRQVLAEFNPDMDVIVVRSDNSTHTTNLAKLLPHAFTPKSLNK